MTTGLVLAGAGCETAAVNTMAAQAKRHGLAVIEDGQGEIPFERYLVVGEGAAVPWDLVNAGLHFVERW
jgi:hypothetical protein